MNERYSPVPVDAILLGGKDPDAVGFNSQYKFSLEVGGRDVLSGVLDALDQASFINRVIFVGPAELVKDKVRGRSKNYAFVDQQGSLWNNVSAGIEKQQQLGGKEGVLVVCSDLPFLTSESVDWLVVNSQQKDSLQVPIVSDRVVKQLSPTYETYYWPMREHPFKLGNNIFIDIDKLSEDRLRLLIEEYRGTASDNYALMSFKRLALLQRYGGAEAVSTLMLNYASKLLQIKCGLNGKVPFSFLRGKGDYERVISKILGAKTEMLPTPFVDVVLDIDNSQRLGIFQRGYQRISEVVHRQADVNIG